MAASSWTPALAFRVLSAALCCRATSRPRPLIGVFWPFSSPLALPPRLVAYARRRKSSSAPAPPGKREGNTLRRKSTVPKDDFDGDDTDEDAFEALFAQLEEDLKNDNLLSDDADDDLTEEDLARLEHELEEALDGDADDSLGVSPDSEILDSEKEDDDENEERPKLKSWQLRRLARALKIGRRKTNIKGLAAELGLERAYVLELLRDPPPNLLLMSASLPDEITQTSGSSTSSLPSDVAQILESERDPLQSTVATGNDVESKPQKELPIHERQARWLMQKRLKKVHVETLERVYSRTKRPTNAMISSIVHVTNLPWKRVLKWFEEKRLEEGIPDHRSPYRRSSTETLSS